MLCVRRQWTTALSTLIRQRHLTPSCGGLTLPRREQWPGKDDRGELDTADPDTENSIGTKQDAALPVVGCLLEGYDGSRWRLARLLRF